MPSDRLSLVCIYGWNPKEWLTLSFNENWTEKLIKYLNNKNDDDIKEEIKWKVWQISWSYIKFGNVAITAGAFGIILRSLTKSPEELEI